MLKKKCCLLTFTVAGKWRVSSQWEGVTLWDNRQRKSWINVKSRVSFSGSSRRVSRRGPGKFDPKVKFTYICNHFNKTAFCPHKYKFRTRTLNRLYYLKMLKKPHKSSVDICFEVIPFSVLHENWSLFWVFWVKVLLLLCCSQKAQNSENCEAAVILTLGGWLDSSFSSAFQIIRNLLLVLAGLGGLCQWSPLVAGLVHDLK